MSILSDVDIREALDVGRIVIWPIDDDSQIQPSSVDLRLGYKILCPKSDFELVSFPKFPTRKDLQIRPWEDNSYRFKSVDLKDDSEYELGAGQSILAEVYENVALNNTIAGRLEGKSSLARLFLYVHSTAGFVDPGWSGHLTLEITNANELPIILRGGMKICQISFFELTSPCERVYGDVNLGSKYKGETVEVSKYQENYK